MALHDTNLELFVLERLRAIRDSLGRSKDQRELKERCVQLLGAQAALTNAARPALADGLDAALPWPAERLQQEHCGEAGSQLTVPFAPDVADQVGSPPPQLRGPGCCACHLPFQAVRVTVSHTAPLPCPELPAAGRPPAWTNTLCCRPSDPA